MDRRFRGLDSRLIHAGIETRLLGAVTPPIFQSVTFERSDETTRYIRLSNTPTHVALHRKLAEIEGGEAALTTASGMAAITSTLLTLLTAGDRVLAQRRLYGGTREFLAEDCPTWGIGCDWIDATDASAWSAALRPTTRLVYVEAMTNPLLEVADLRSIVAFARDNGLVSVIDSTFATPVNLRPLELGFDLAIHSCTKYLNGHDDIAAGAVIGRAALIERIAARLARLGGILDPHAAFLLDRGLATLGVRVRHQNASGLEIARFLADHPTISHVSYPGLESHPHHARARELFDGFGGVVSFELADDRSAERFMAALALLTAAPSLGGVHSLVMRPAAVWGTRLSPEERARLGITDGLVRLSIGLETRSDIVADLTQALGA